MVGRREGVVGRGGEQHLVVAGHESGEEVVAVEVGDGGVDHRSVGVDQDHLQAGHAGFAGVLLAVPVEVVPHRVAERGGLEEAGVHVQEGVAGLQHQERPAAGPRIRVAVGPVAAAGVGPGEVIAGGRHEFDRIRAGRQILEEVVAVGIGDRGPDELACTVVQVDGDIGEAGFAGFLDAVPVLVEPHGVAEARGLVETGVDAGVVLAIVEVNHRAPAGVRVDVAVEGFAGLVGSADGEAVGNHDLDDVVTGLEVVEEVVAIGVGDRLGQGVAIRVKEVDPHPGDTRFRFAGGGGGILRAIGVAVVPHPVAERGSHIIDFGWIVVFDLGQFGNVIALGRDRVASCVGRVDEILIEGRLDKGGDKFARSEGHSGECVREGRAEILVAEDEVGQVGVAGVLDGEAVGHWRALGSGHPLLAGAGRAAVMAAVHRLVQREVRDADIHFGVVHVVHRRRVGQDVPVRLAGEADDIGHVGEVGGRDPLLV